MQDRSAAIEELVEQCLPTCLGLEGHSIYLRNPQGKEVAQLVFAATWQEAEHERKQLRRILCGIIGKALEEYAR